MEIQTLHIVLQICTFPKFLHCDTELQNMSMLHWFAEIYDFTSVAIMFCISVKSSPFCHGYVLFFCSYFIFSMSVFLCGNIPTLNCHKRDLFHREAICFIGKTTFKKTWNKHLQLRQKCYFQLISSRIPCQPSAKTCVLSILHAFGGWEHILKAF